jgi:predicted component of type VI protein secretion system
MIQLHLLNGATAGQRFESEKFPITVGRSADCSLALNEPGVFDRHFEIKFSAEGFTLQPFPNAVVAVNGVRADAPLLLRNGDLLNAGYPKIQFWLGALKQRGLKIREGFAWLMIAAIIATQAYCLTSLLALTR